MYIVASKVKARAKEAGKRVGRDFLDRLNRHVEGVIEKALTTHNGNKKTLDATVADFILGKS